MGKRKKTKERIDKHFRDPVVTGLPPLLRGLPSISEDAFRDKVFFWGVEDGREGDERRSRKKERKSRPPRDQNDNSVACGSVLGSVPACSLSSPGRNSSA